MAKRMSIAEAYSKQILHTDFVREKYQEMLARVERERDDLMHTMRAIMEETVLAGYPGGDRVQTLANVRRLRRELDELRKR